MTVIARRHIWTLALVLSAGATLLAQAAQTAPQIDRSGPFERELAATQTFRDRVDEYVSLHRLLEGPLPPLKPTRNMDEVRINMELLAGRLVRARPDARQGDIISDEVARLFRRRIASCLSPEEWTVILSELSEDEEGVPTPVVELRVNMAWPDQMPFGFVPPQLLSALPALPAELQYRIIGGSLVLWDHHANLIVDFLPRAFTT